MISEKAVNATVSYAGLMSTFIGVERLGYLRETLSGSGGSEAYNALVTKYSKPVVDMVISGGADVIWAVGLPMVTAAAGTVISLFVRSERANKIPVAAAITGSAISFMVGISSEWSEIVNPASLKVCAERGTMCGDVNDLIIFSIPAVAMLVFAGKNIVQKRLKIKRDI